MFDVENYFNFATKQNGVSIVKATSEQRKCLAENVLCDEGKSFWLSNQLLPQFIVIDLTKMRTRPKQFFDYFAVYCFKTGPTNPRLIDLYYSFDNKEYFILGKFQLDNKSGIQLFKIQNNDLQDPSSIAFIKIVVRRTFGGFSTYINQIFFFDNKTKKTTKDKKHTRNEAKEQLYSSDRTPSPSPDSSCSFKGPGSGNNYQLFLSNSCQKKKSFPFQSYINKNDSINLINNNNISNPQPNSKAANSKLLISLSNYKTIASTQKEFFSTNRKETISSEPEYQQESRTENKLANASRSTENIKNEFEQKMKDLDNYITEMKNQYDYVEGQNEEVSEEVAVENNKTPIAEDYYYGYKITTIEEKINNIQSDINEIKNMMGDLTEGLEGRNANENAKEIENDVLEKIDVNLTQKLDELSGSIQNHIYSNFVQPSMEQFDIRLKKNLKEIKREIRDLSSIVRGERSVDLVSESSSRESRYSPSRFEEASSIANKLYKKLLKKEKILNEKASMFRKYLN